MPDEIFHKPKPLLRGLFDRFRAGNNSWALAAVGCLLGAALLIGFETGWQRRIAYDSVDLHVQVLFWAVGAAFVAALWFMPDKFESWRYPLGMADIDGPKDWLLLIGSVVGSSVVLVAVSELVALYGHVAP